MSLPPFICLLRNLRRATRSDGKALTVLRHGGATGVASVALFWTMLSSGVSANGRNTIDTLEFELAKAFTNASVIFSPSETTVSESA